MKVTGYKLQQMIREATQERDLAAQQWDGSLLRFDSEPEDKPHPDDVMRRFLDAESKVARTQTALQQFNLQVQVAVRGKSMRLADAIKLVGGAGRSEKMWRKAATPKSAFDRYSGVKDSRSKDEEFAKWVLSNGESAKRAREAGRYASALREAIQVGNATEVDIQLETDLVGSPD